MGKAILYQRSCLWPPVVAIGRLWKLRVWSHPASEVECRLGQPWERAVSSRDVEDEMTRTTASARVRVRVGIG